MSADKTEEPTAKKLADARREGRVPKSRELGTAAVILATAGVLVFSGKAVVDSLAHLIRTQLSRAGAVGAQGVVFDATSALEAGLNTGIDALLPVLACALFAATVSSYVQVGPLFSVKSLAPKLERLDLIKGIGNLFTRRQLVELLKTLLKMLIVGSVAAIVLRDGLRGVVGLAERDAAAALQGAGELVSRLMFRVGGAVLGIAVVDVLYQRWQHRKDLHMSKDEVKREHKDAEGDPHTRAERDRVRREIVEYNAVERVRTADVLVVNPTHLAIALQYDEDVAEAPVVLSKGQDHLAARMRRAAEESGVPVLRDINLAHSLYELEHDEEIPEVLYEAVAAVLRAAWDERDER